jgi:methylmalonyl-CoA mutase N-terminal domain/subunit
VSKLFVFYQYIVAAEEQGVKPEQLAGTIQVSKLFPFLLLWIQCQK